MLTTLAYHQINSLQHLIIRDEKAWFENERDESMTPLLAILDQLRQTQQLQTLDLNFCGLNSEHWR